METLPEDTALDDIFWNGTGSYQVQCIPSSIYIWEAQLEILDMVRRFL